VRRIVELAHEAGAHHITPVALHLRPGVKEVFMEWLAAARPDLVDRYGELYDGRSYAPSPERERLSQLVRNHRPATAASRFDRRRARAEAASATADPALSTEPNTVDLQPSLF
jgi:DNA repair photolyase